MRGVAERGRRHLAPKALAQQTRRGVAGRAGEVVLPDLGVEQLLAALVRRHDFGRAGIHLDRHVGRKRLEVEGDLVVWRRALLERLPQRGLGAVLDPALDEFEAKYRDKVTVLGVDTRDLSEDAMNFIEEYGLEYAQARDASGNYADDLKTTGVPESFLVDPEGNLVAHYPGPFRDLESIEKFAAPALEAQGVPNK